MTELANEKDNYELNFEWTEEDMKEWKIKAEKLERTFTSEYIGVHYSKSESKYIATIINRDRKKGSKDEKQLLFSKAYKDEISAARSRDLFIIDVLKDNQYKLNFEWTEKEKEEWRKKLKENKKEPSSKYIGVSFRKDTKKYTASISNPKWRKGSTTEKAQLFKKDYVFEKEAAFARDLFILVHLAADKDKYQLNFEWTEKLIKIWREKLNI